MSLKTASEVERGSEGLDYDGVRKVIKTVLLTVASKDSTLRVFDLRAQRLLLFAADLVFTKNEADQRDEVKAAINLKVASWRSDNYTVRDPVVAWLMMQENSKARKGDDKVALGFAVAGAFPRAMSTQAGLKVYFGAKHIAALAREEMRIRALPENEVLAEGSNAQAAAVAKKAASVGLYATNVRDLAAEVQKIISHTLWQVSIPAANWENGADRARVLRLAALGYYATDYARVSMDEFVAFLQDFANGFLDRDMPGPGSLRGARLSRRQVENAVAECFSFARFEANTEDVFDLDAPFAYWSDHGDMGGKSVAQAIYQELMDLRQKALAHFDSAVGAISWLRYKDLYFPGKDPAVSEAYKAKEFAWRHFRIFNFYDAERYMGKASALLARRLETIATDEKNIAKWREELRLESKRRESV
ncbi:MAG: hypothetical protein DCF16_11615 [Alphaproteobacteria bacterium]|nr:MAG: hypothetical protein DCF16_11615 [Alphaproteobacteria bacterium]